MNTDGLTIEIEEFALSCRAMGKKVEHSFFFYLINLFNSNSYKSLNISVVESSRNQQMVRTLEGVGFNKGKTSQKGDHIFSDYSFKDKKGKLEFPKWFELELEK